MKNNTKLKEIKIIIKKSRLDKDGNTYFSVIIYLNSKIKVIKTTCGYEDNAEITVTQYLKNNNITAETIIYNIYNNCTKTEVNNLTKFAFI